MKIRNALLTGAILFSVNVVGECDEIPTQKPGLWQVTMTSAKIPGGSRTFKMCQDAASVAAAKMSADSIAKNDCSKNDVVKHGDTWVSDSECKMSGMHVVTHSETTVHSDEAFHTQLQSSMGAAKPVLTTIDHKYLGACEAGQKVGVPLLDK
ncbi:MAG: DUF3617 family protein [Rudaea sp.]